MEQRKLFDNYQKLGLFCVISFSIGFIILLHYHLMSGVIAGLLTYTLTVKLDAFLSEKLTLGTKSKLCSVLILSTLIMVIFIGGSSYLFTWFIGMAKNPAETMQSINGIMDSISNTLPENLIAYLPDDFDETRKNLLSYLKQHVFYLQSVAQSAFHLLIIIIVGMVIGLILGYQKNKRSITEKITKPTPLIKSLKASLNRLVHVFQYVVIAQVAISLFNTAMTAIFLFIILPIFGVHLPFAKSLVVATFVLGLIPIIGNLIVNALMFCVAFTVSLSVAITVLCYLILIHKMEYVLNAKIVGGRIQSGICELLIAMFFLETIFGIVGLVFAPIFYAFLKLSLKELKLI